MQLPYSIESSYQELRRALPTDEEQEEGARVSDPQTVRNVVRIFVDALCENSDTAGELQRRAALVATLTAENSPYLIAKQAAHRALRDFSGPQNVEGAAGHFLSSLIAQLKNESGRTLVDEVRNEDNDLQQLLDFGVDLPPTAPPLLKGWQDEARKVVSAGERCAADGCHWLVNHESPAVYVIMTVWATEIRRAADAMVANARNPAEVPAAKMQQGEGNDHELDRKFMERAVEEARKSRTEDSRVHPKVGVVIAKDGRELATAYRGELEEGDHAEFTALEKKLADQEVAGATVYTTLEPCTTRHHRKVPCADRLIGRKVKRVVIGMHDPNPAISGKGFMKLREANITVDLFPPDLMSKIEDMNREFIRHHKNPPMSWMRRFVVWLRS